MTVTLDEMKNYLRVEHDDDDELIQDLIWSAEKTAMDITRTEELDSFYSSENSKIAVMYTVAYLYEHREAADHHGLTLMLRSLLFGDREAAF